MPLRSIFYFIQTKLFEGGWLFFFFLFGDPSRWPKWHLRPDQVTILSLSFRPTPSATCPEASSAAKRPDSAWARVFLRHQERAVRALSSLVIILWAERPLKVPSNLLTVRLVEQYAENKEPARPAGRPASRWSPGLLGHHLHSLRPHPTGLWASTRHSACSGLGIREKGLLCLATDV